MGSLTGYVDLIVVLLGAIIGSMKASVEFDKDKLCFARLVDIALGVFCGCALAYHFQNQGSLALSGLIALIGGVSGAMVVEVIMQMLPSIVRRAVKDWTENKLK